MREGGEPACLPALHQEEIELTTDYEQISLGYGAKDKELRITFMVFCVVLVCLMVI